MKTIRIALRLVAVTVFTVSLLVVTIAGYLVFGWTARLRIVWRGYIVRWWSSGVLAIAGARLDVQGIPPSPPFMLVSNHVSYIDILALATQINTTFVSRADVGSWPIVGLLTRVGGTIFINRQSKKEVVRVNQIVLRTYEKGGGIVFFPESTTSKGDAVHRFRAPLLEPAALHLIPVCYGSVSYRTPAGYPPAYRVICWWNGDSFPAHLAGILALPRFEVRLRFGDEPVSLGDRKQLAERLEERVRSLFTPMTAEARPDGK